jgi:hypothetical protein
MNLISELGKCNIQVGLPALCSDHRFSVIRARPPSQESVSFASPLTLAHKLEVHFYLEIIIHSSQNVE